MQSSSKIGREETAVKKFFWRFMLVLVLAEIIISAIAWNQSYTQAYVREATNTGVACKCGASFLTVSSDDYTWEFDGKVVDSHDVSRDELVANCWEDRAVNAAWFNSLGLIIRFLVLDLGIIFFGTVVLYEDFWFGKSRNE